MLVPAVAEGTATLAAFPEVEVAVFIPVISLRGHGVVWEGDPRPFSGWGYGLAQTDLQTTLAIMRERWPEAAAEVREMGLQVGT